MKITFYSKCRVFLVMALSIVLCGCGTKNYNSAKVGDSNMASAEVNTLVSDSEEEYPMILCIETTLYYGTEEKCEMLPRKAPDGKIETFIEKEIMPDADGVANFGADKGPLEYMFLEDGRLIVHVGENWYYFKKQETDTPVANYKTYEFETFDGTIVSIDDTNIISQEKVEDVLESANVPSDAEVIAPGRDYVYLADSNKYYVEDAVDQLFTIAKKND